MLIVLVLLNSFSNKVTSNKDTTYKMEVNMTSAEVRQLDNSEPSHHVEQTEHQSTA